MPSSLATFHQPSALGPLLDALATLLTWQFSLFLANLAKAHNWFTSTFLFYIFFPFISLFTLTHSKRWCLLHSLLPLVLLTAGSFSLARSLFLRFISSSSNQRTHTPIRTHAHSLWNPTRRIRKKGKKFLAIFSKRASSFPGAPPTRHLLFICLGHDLISQIY